LLGLTNDLLEREIARFQEAIDERRHMDAVIGKRRVRYAAACAH